MYFLLQIQITYKNFYIQKFLAQTKILSKNVFIDLQKI